VNRTSPASILKQYWGYDAFRSLQEEIIQSVLDGRDTLALMPTGGGKSICFQVPALCQEGICLVVSPLIALMKDQVSNLKKRGIQAEAIHTGMSPREIDRILDNCIYGTTRFLYLSPERLASDLAKARIARMNVNLLAVDEAHCVSQWGYDFRPPYLEIAAIREVIRQDVPVLAVTATATREVVADIQEKLKFREENVFRKSFQRENLSYVVLTEDNKREKMLDILRKVPGSAVVYARNRRMTQEMARFLRENGISADFYHAGLSTEERSRKQDAWINGQTRVVACTNAFGMGIDKPDVRTVIHLDLPESLEAYFQEAGRAGRDGNRSYAVLLYSGVDRLQLERNLATSFPPLQDIRQVYRALGSFFQLATGGGEYQSFDFDIALFCKNFKLDPLKTYSCLHTLEQEGWIVLTEAVTAPSVFTVTVGREQLYDFQLRNQKLDALIKTLLRLSEGAFQDFARVNEHQVARVMKTDADKVIAALKLLDREGMISYRPAKDKPQLVFSKERVPADDLTIDLAHYNFRKQRHEYRLKQAMGYAENPVCRSQQLLAYFAETAPECGRCDVCLEKSKEDLSGGDFGRYKERITGLLEKTALSEREILQAFPSNQHQQLLKVLSFLLDEEYLEREGERLRLKISP
jgi:ATP-dependent DNA helicase RecQ